MINATDQTPHLRDLCEITGWSFLVILSGPEYDEQHLTKARDQRLEIRHQNRLSLMMMMLLHLSSGFIIREHVEQDGFGSALL